MSTDGRLTRALSARDLAVYYLSSLVGVGVLVVPGIALSKAGPASLPAWAILSVASLPIAVTFARFSARYPSAGGVSFLVRQAFGWRPGTAIGLFCCSSTCRPTRSSGWRRPATWPRCSAGRGRRRCSWAGSR